MQRNMQQTTCDRQHATDNTQRTTCGRQRAADDMRRTTCDGQHATDNMRRTTCDGQHATDNMQRTTCNGQHATDDLQQTTGKQATFSTQRATGNRQQVTDNMQHATCQHGSRIRRTVSAAGDCEQDVRARCLTEWRLPNPNTKKVAGAEFAFDDPALPSTARRMGIPAPVAARRCVTSANQSAADRMSRGV
jgi:hypothetical protein